MRDEDMKPKIRKIQEDLWIVEDPVIKAAGTTIDTAWKNHVKLWWLLLKDWKEKHCKLC